MGSKRKIVLASIICALIVICTGTAVIWFMNPDGFETTYQKQIHVAEQYFANGDYENAIIAYKAAIVEDDKKEEPYQRLTMIYLLRDETELAESILKQGIANTSSYELQKMWVSYFEKGSDAIQALADQAGEKKAEGEMAVNRTLLSEIAAATYRDFRLKYGEPSVSQSDQVYTVTYGDTGILYCYYNTAEDDHVIDKVIGQPYSEAKPNEASFQNLSLLFSGMGENMDYKTLSQLAVRSLKKSYEKEMDRYVVSFLCGGCNVMIESDENGNVLSRNAWNKVIPVKAEAEEESFSVEGEVIDATTGDGVSGALVSVRAGSEKTGKALAEVTTESDGSYAVDLECGDYTVEVELEGYTTEYFEMYVNSSGDTDDAQFVISPTVESGQIRIVLEWGSAPADLDSYLEGSLSDGTSVAISYRNKTLERGGEKIVTLDVDDTDGYGPETTTINDSGGTYHFYVLDYRQEGSLGINGASVKIYMPGEAAPVVIDAPSDLQNGWDVLDIDKGVLTINNCAM